MDVESDRGRTCAAPDLFYAHLEGRRPGKRGRHDGEGGLVWNSSNLPRKRANLMVRMPSDRVDSGLGFKG
jgi:hypothetical protein